MFVLDENSSEEQDPTVSRLGIENYLCVSRNKYVDLLPATVNGGGLLKKTVSKQMESLDRQKSSACDDAQFTRYLKSYIEEHKLRHNGVTLTRFLNDTLSRTAEYEALRADEKLMRFYDYINDYRARNYALRNFRGNRDMKTKVAEINAAKMKPYDKWILWDHVRHAAGTKCTCQDLSGIHNAYNDDDEDSESNDEICHEVDEQATNKNKMAEVRTNVLRGNKY